MEGQIGAVGTYEIKFEAGKLVASLAASHGAIDANVVLKLDAIQVIDALEKAIPGQLDDALLELLKKALA